TQRQQGAAQRAGPIAATLQPPDPCAPVTCRALEQPLQICRDLGALMGAAVTEHEAGVLSAFEHELRAAVLRLDAQRYGSLERELIGTGLQTATALAAHDPGGEHPVIEAWHAVHVQRRASAQCAHQSYQRRCRRV